MSLAKGNRLLNSYTNELIMNLVELAQKNHPWHHQNASTLKSIFCISKKQARQIVRDCKNCPTWAQRESTVAFTLQAALFVLNFLNADDKGLTPWTCIGIIHGGEPLVMWKDILTSKWHGPGVLIVSGRSYACVFP